MGGRDDSGHELVREHIVLDHWDDAGIDFGDIRHAAATDDDLRVEDIADHGQSAAQTVNIAVKGLLRPRVALAGVGDDGLPADPPTRIFRMISFEGHA